jgi:hypothetical protein
MTTYHSIKPTKTAGDSRIKHQVYALHAVHHKHAAKATRLTHLLHMVSRNLLNLHKKFHKEAIAVAGKHYKDNHLVCFD